MTNNAVPDDERPLLARLIEAIHLLAIEQASEYGHDGGNDPVEWALGHEPILVAAYREALALMTPAERLGSPSVHAAHTTTRMASASQLSSGDE